MRFEWDERKNKANIRKHGVSFEEASTVFRDPTAELFADPEHSCNEDRFYLVGHSTSFRFLTVCHCYRLHGHLIRIISAWRTRPTELKRLRRNDMRHGPDFSTGRPNPYFKSLTKPFTVYLDDDTIAYFKAYGEEIGMPWEGLLSNYLRAAAHFKHKFPYDPPQD